MWHEQRLWSVSAGAFVHGAGERCGRFVAKAGMRADVIVVMPPLLDDRLRFYERIKTLAV